MDSTDAKIFCEMTSRHTSASGIADKLGLDEKTVRSRIRKMEDKGFIKYYQGSPNLALFGFKSSISFRFNALNLETKLGVLREIQTMPGVVEARDYLGPVISFELSSDTRVECRKLAGAIAQKFELRTSEIGQRALTPLAIRLDKLDWRVIQALRYDAKRGTSEIARSIGVTRRMAEHRVKKLLKSGALTVRPIIDPQKQEGLIFYELECVVDKENQGAVSLHVRKTYGEKLWSVSSLSSGLLLLNLFCFTLNEPEEAATTLLGVKGVRLSSLFILKGVLEPEKPNWIDKLIITLGKRQESKWS